MAESPIKKTIGDSGIQEYKKFAFDVGITFFASVVTLPLGFLITVLLGRYLGAGDLGLYRMTSTIYGLAMLFAAIGIPAAMIKYVAEFKNDRTKFNQIVSSGVITSLFLGIGFIALFYFSSEMFAEIFNMPRLSDLIKILSLVFPFALVNGALLGLLNGIREMKKHAAAMIVQSVLMVIVTVALIYYGFGIAGAVIGIVLSSIGSCLFLWIISKSLFDLTLRNYVETTKKMLSFGVQMFTVSAVNLIANQTDIILIGYFMAASAIGYYSVAIGISGLLLLIPFSIQRITYPATSSYWTANNHNALDNMINKSMKYSTCILLILGLGVGFFAKEIITLIFKEGFILAVLPLNILLIARVIRGGTIVPVGTSLAAVGRPDLNLKADTISAAVNISLNILLIPHFGIVGAAIATTSSLLLGTVILLIFLRKILSVNIDVKWYAQIMGFALIAILSFIGGIRLLNPYLVGGTILSVYAILTIKFFLTHEDKEIFKSLLYSAISEVRYAWNRRHRI